MFLLDRMLIGGIRFALDKVAAAVDEQLNDDSVHRDRLLDAQMKLELGEITEEEFAAVEADVLRTLREIKERRDGPSEPGLVLGGDMEIVGASADFLGEEHEPLPEPEPEAVAAAAAAPETPASRPPVAGPPRSSRPVAAKKKPARPRARKRR